MLGRLLHRWFVQYNPLYLLSALLVLVGLSRISSALVNDPSITGHLAVGVASELYAYCVIGGAALLTRLGLLRPATFLALIAVLYQGDLALTTETNTLLQGWAWAASLVWLASFAFKLRLLASALRLRPSASAWGVACFGALGVAVIPLLTRSCDEHTVETVFGAWLFGVVTLALWTRREVESERWLDPWARTVKRRSLRATWIVWAILGAMHVYLWTERFHVRTVIVVPVALLLATRVLRREAHLAACLGAVMLWSACTMPSLLPVTASLSAATFVVHAFRRVPLAVAPVSPVIDQDGAYRGATTAEPPPATLFELPPAAERTRKLVWATYALYVAVWSSQAQFPAHLLLLDGSLLLAIALVVGHARELVMTGPLLVSLAHWAVRARIVRAPQSTLEWGVASLSMGFVLLLVSLVTSWWMRPTDATDEELGDTAR